MVPNNVGSLSKRPRGTQSKNSGFSSQNRTAGASARVVTASVSPPARAAGMPTTAARIPPASPAASMAKPRSQPGALGDPRAQGAPHRGEGHLAEAHVPGPAGEQDQGDRHDGDDPGDRGDQELAVRQPEGEGQDEDAGRARAGGPRPSARRGSTGARWGWGAPPERPARTTRPGRRPGCRCPSARAAGRPRRSRRAPGTRRGLARCRTRSPARRSPTRSRPPRCGGSCPCGPAPRRPGRGPAP